MRGWFVGLVGLTAITSGGTLAVVAYQGPEVVTAMEADGAPASPTSASPTSASSSSTTSTTQRAPSTSTTERPPRIPSCDPADEPADGDPVEDWATIVVDPAHQLPDGFEPPRILDVSRGAHGEIRVRDIVVPDLVGMLDAAEAAGSPLLLVSGYRTYEYQRDLYRDAVEEDGEEVAARTVARPGHSEHQLGTAVDVLAPGMDDLSPAFGDTPAGRWVADNAHRYGFVISYPPDSLRVACYSYEPWHLRYVGRDRARQIVESGVAPRAWMLTRESPEPG